MSAIVDRPNVYAIETQMELLKSWRMPQFVLPTLFFPLAFYTLFGVVLSGSGMGSNAGYLLATFGVFGAMGPSLFGFGVGIAMEEDQGLLEMKRVAPMPASALIVAKLLSAMVFTAVVMIGLYLIATLAGGVRLDGRSWGLLAFIHLLTTVPFALLGLAIGMAMKGQGAIAVTNIVFLVMSVLGGLWIPIFLFPQYLQAVALALPSYHLGELALAVIGFNDDVNIALSVFVIAFYIVTFSVLTIFLWRAKKQ